MKIIQIPRGAGKTAKLLEMMAADAETVYVAPNVAMAADAFKRARSLGFGISRERFVSASLAYSRTHEMLQDRKLLVDELELVLSRLLGSRVEVATTSDAELVSA